MAPIRSYVGTHFLVLFEHLNLKIAKLSPPAAPLRPVGQRLGINGSMLGGPKAAEVGAISGLKLRKWRALARQEARASAPAKAAEVGDLPDPYLPPEPATPRLSTPPLSISLCIRLTWNVDPQRLLAELFVLPYCRRILGCGDQEQDS